MKLIVEIDGSVHDKQREQDAERKDLIERLGFRFVRVKSEDVEHELGGVLEEVRRVIDEIG